MAGSRHALTPRSKGQSLEGWVKVGEMSGSACRYDCTFFSRL